jgi:hypothetical protein
MTLKVQDGIATKGNNLETQISSSIQEDLSFLQSSIFAYVYCLSNGLGYERLKSYLGDYTKSI